MQNMQNMQNLVIQNQLQHHQGLADADLIQQKLNMKD